MAEPKDSQTIVIDTTATRALAWLVGLTAVLVGFLGLLIGMLISTQNRIEGLERKHEHTQAWVAKLEGTMTRYGIPLPERDDDDRSSLQDDH